MTCRVLLLGGTTEARELAELLGADPAIEITTSLAGRTATPHHPPGQVRVGGFGGATGLAAWLTERHVDAVIDASHPYAATITRNAVTATRHTGHPLLLLRRPPWHAQPGDHWHWARTTTDTIKRLPSLGRRVFLTTGRRDLTVPEALPHLWFLLRSVDPPTGTPPNVTAVQGRGPFTAAGELDLLRRHRVDLLVTRDSGGPRTKLDAARTHDIPVLLLRRPAPPANVPAVETVREAAAWLRASA
jgi:precorrin-6A/cobalt-precorrin-6A reductase